MTLKRRKRFGLDIIINGSQFLFLDEQLNTFQAILKQCAPEWSKHARKWRSPSDQEPVKLSRMGAIEDLIRQDETRLRNSPIAEWLTTKLKEQGVETPKPRFTGSIELRGQDDALTVVIGVDEFSLTPRPDNEYIFGNHIALQVRRSRLEGEETAIWSRQVFKLLCQTLSAFHGSVYTNDEFDAKNISYADGGVEAIGIDVSRYLPGIYWMNFFGQPYCDLIGKERLLSAPAAEVHPIADGVLLKLADDPKDWATPEYKAAEQRVLEHIGPEYFFSRENPDKPTVAPRFELAREAGNTK